jgi:hypothetical protein
MSIFTFNPLHDSRWATFIDGHETASIFHTQEWLSALKETYRYEPIVYTTEPPDVPLHNAIVFCKINSWLTGRRLISLPFSDHCDPILDNAKSANRIFDKLREVVSEGRLKYVELRPKSELYKIADVYKAPPCYLHMLDLNPDAVELFGRMHKSCIQRPIKRAQNSGIKYQCGNSEQLLKAFYTLMVMTRRRHQLPPQPINWFRNLIECMGKRLKIRVAYKDDEAIASMITIQHNSVVVYKYGCSNSKFHNLGAMQFLFWQTILEAKSEGMRSMDFGRSDADNPGLIAFKDRWGTTSVPMVYVRWSQEPVHDVSKGSSAEIVKRLFSVMPDSLLKATGKILYRHMA